MKQSVWPGPAHTAGPGFGRVSPAHRSEARKAPEAPRGMNEAAPHQVGASLRRGSPRSAGWWVVSTGGGCLVVLGCLSELGGGPGQRPLLPTGRGRAGH